MLRCTCVRRSVAATVRSAQRSAAYLRHAPPSLYITMDAAAESAGDGASGEEVAPPMRHCTRLLDSAAGTDRCPHAHGVFLLSSTNMADITFQDAAALQSVLVGLPRVRSAAEAGAFVAAHESHLRSVRAVVVPAVGCGGAGHAVRALRAALPTVTFHGSPFCQALLTDPTFFDGVRRTVMANDNVDAAAVPFAELPADAFAVAEDGAVVARVGRRVLTARWPNAEPSRRLRRGQPPHFYEQPVYVHDSAFGALHIGPALCRLPWLPQVLAEADRDVLLPAPPLLAARGAAAGPTAPLLATWRPSEAVEVLAEAVRRGPLVQRLLCETFGEPPRDPDSSVAAAAHTAAQLEAIRSRLSARLQTDTGRDLQRWGPAMLDTVLREVVCPNTASQPTSEAAAADFRSAALAGENALGTVAVALTRSALSLPPDHPAAAPSVEGVASAVAAASPSGPKGHPAEDSSELQGAAGVALMQNLLKVKGLGGLGPVIAKEEIDVSVFLTMSPDDFKRVLKATFGVSKKLELLQQELRSKL